MIDLYFLILAVITKIFNATEEHAIPTGTPPKEAKAETETNQQQEKQKHEHALSNQSHAESFMLFTY